MVNLDKECETTKENRTMSRLIMTGAELEDEYGIEIGEVDPNTKVELIRSFCSVCGEPANYAGTEDCLPITEEVYCEGSDTLTHEYCW